MASQDCACHGGDKGEMAAAPSSPFISLVAELSQGLELVEGFCLLLGRRQQGRALEPSGLGWALLVGWGHHAGPPSPHQWSGDFKPCLCPRP